MIKLKSLIKTSLLGGVAVILPSAILIFIFKWIFGIVTDIIQPLSTLVMAKSQLREVLADLFVLAIILTVCFVVGLAVKTKIGRFIHDNLETYILKIAPGYRMIKETVMQFIGKRKSPFSSVALVQLFGTETLMTAFITDSHSDSTFSVFVPTGPNPTSGNIYHLKAEYVHPVDVPIESAMRSIISCGAGSSVLIEAYNKKISSDAS